MDDLNEMARLHSAGATVKHHSPFSDLPSPKNEALLSIDFVRKWATPFYMEIGKCGDRKWIDAIKEIKHEITPEICLFLLSDFNWRTRLVGTYFAAVKGYKDFINIIGTHLLKSEVCCVGHIYALTLAFFNTDESVDFLNRYLQYYLTKPNLYFDQDIVMEAILYLDKTNGTHHFTTYLETYNTIEQNRKPLEDQSATKIAKLIEEQEGKDAAADFLNEIASHTTKNNKQFSTDYFDEQIPILCELNQYG